MRISQLETTINTQYVNTENVKLQAHIRLVDDFRTACDGLAEYFACCSRPIVDTFPKISKRPGEIKLESDPSSSNPVILWVYYNIHVQIGLSLPEGDISNANHKQARQQFYDFANRLFQRIEDGMVSTKNERALPDIPDPATPDPVRVGQTFTVDVDPGPKGSYYDDVECDNKVSLMFSLLFLVVNNWRVSIRTYAMEAACAISSLDKCLMINGNVL